MHKVGKTNTIKQIQLKFNLLANVKFYKKKYSKWQGEMQCYMIYTRLFLVSLELSSGNVRILNLTRTISLPNLLTGWLMIVTLQRHLLTISERLGRALVRIRTVIFEVRSMYLGGRLDVRITLGIHSLVHII